MKTARRVSAAQHKVSLKRGPKTVPLPAEFLRIPEKCGSAWLCFFDEKLQRLWVNESLSPTETEKISYSLPCSKIMAKPPDPCPLCPLLQALQQNRPVDGFCLSPHRAAGLRYHILAWPLPNNSCGPVRLVVAALELGELPPPTETVGQSEWYYRTLFEHSGTAVALVGEDGTLLDINQRFENITGYRREEIVGKMRSVDFNKDKEGDLLYHRLRRLDPGWAPKNYEGTLLCKDGSERTMHISVDLIPGTSQSIVSMIDITEKRHLEKAVRKTENYLANLMRNSIVGICSADADIRLSSWNRGAQNIFGYQSQEIIGQSAELLWDPQADNVERIRTMLRDLREKGFVENFLALHRHKSGRQILLELNMTSIRDDHGQFVGMGVVFRDVTQQKAMERKLMQQEKMSLLGQLSAALTHEIKNPLNSLFINLEVLRNRLQRLDSSAQEQLSRPLTVVNGELQRLHQVIENFLDFARPAGERKTAIDLNHILHKVIELVSIQAERNGTRIEFQAGASLPPLLGEENQLRQIFLNLVLNSLEAIPSSGTVRISTAHDAQQGKIVCRLQDDGPGIAPEHRARIFDLYFSTKRKGSGIGLPLVKRLVEEHGGQIILDDLPPPGASFTISFPQMQDRP